MANLFLYAFLFYHYAFQIDESFKQKIWFTFTKLKIVVCKSNKRKWETEQNKQILALRNDGIKMI